MVTASTSLDTLGRLGPGEGGDYARRRLHENGKRLVGEILVDELPDDSVAAYEPRATMAEDDINEGGRRIAALMNPEHR